VRSRWTYWLALVMALGLGSYAALGAPQISIDTEIYDFGVAFEGDEAVFAFLIENTGDETLIIERLSASCGCTTTSLSSDEIEPGQTVRLGGTFDTSGYGGMQASKNVYVSTNDPDRAEITLRITGRVVETQAYLVEANEIAGGLMILVDLRDPEAYAAGHLPGAVNLSALTADVWLELLPQHVRTVLVDADGTVSEAVAEQMLVLGFLDVEVLLGGMDEWFRQYGDRMLVSLPLVIGVMGADG